MTENRMSTPTLINLPPPQSDPVTPSDMGPGTPNSGTTSLSALSTTAIKDGHQGHPHPYARHTHQSSSASATSTSTLEAERADRISRLAGLERIATARAGGGEGGGNQNIAASLAPTVTSGAGGGHYTQQQYNPNNIHNYNQQGYFDSYPQQLLKERSTVGSASATGSIGGRTTWASGSDAFDPDKMSEDQDHDSSSVGGDDVDDRMSDEGNASLVGFGEGANSTISGPISTISAPATAGAVGGGGGGGVPGGPVRLQSSSSTGTNPPPRPSTFGSPPGNRNSGGGFGNNNPYATISQQQQQRFFSPSPAGSNTPEPFDDARMLDGMTYDSDIVDTTVRTPRLVGGQNEQDGSGHNSPGR